MNKQEIVSLLKSNHAEFINRLNALSDADLCYAPEGKWSGAQQLDHIIKSVSPVNIALGIPKFIITWKFGKANRPSRSFSDLVDKYKRKLQEGGRASGRFVPAPVTADQKEQMIGRLKHVVDQLCRRTEKHTEEALDKYILPHPLLGKLTFREMLYFTAHHVKHHQDLVEKGLAGR